MIARTERIKCMRKNEIKQKEKMQRFKYLVKIDDNINV